MPVTQSVESRIVLYMQRAIQTGLGVDPSQTSIGIIKLRDSAWLGPQHFQVVPDSPRSDGGGKGAQEGGALFRRQRVSVFVYTRLNVDQYGMSGELLVDATLGTLDIFEALRNLFAYTFFGDADGTNCLLTEPLTFSLEGKTVWEDQAGGWVSREFTWEAMYGVELPGITIFLSDVVNATA